MIIGNYRKILSNVQLFKGINESELEPLLACIGAELKSVKKGEMILMAGEKPVHVGIALAGQLLITREDHDGNRLVLNAVSPGEIYAEALCCAGVQESPVSVMAGADSVIMRLGFSRIAHVCPNTCAFHGKVIENMLELIAGKNLLLQSRMEIVRLKSVRAKVMRYLESLSQRQSREIVIPFNREEMADFLCVERSALSHELAKMQKDGLITYRKNRFIITHP